MSPDTKRQQKLVVQWNERYPVGTKVVVKKDDGTFVETITTAKADMLGGHTAVIWLEDISGCYMLSRVTPYPKGK